MYISFSVFLFTKEHFYDLGTLHQTTRKKAGKMIKWQIYKQFYE